MAIGTALGTGVAAALLVGFVGAFLALAPSLTLIAQVALAGVAVWLLSRRGSTGG